MTAHAIAAIRGIVGSVLARDAWSLFRSALVTLAVLAACSSWSEYAAAQPSEPPRVLFLMPALDESTRAQLQDALYAQLALVDGELVLREEQEGQNPRALAEAENARAVLWLDASGERWLLHIVDLAQERSVLRRIDARSGQQAAAIEAVAVLAREASRGGPLGEEPNEAEPTDTPSEPAATVEPTEPAAPPAAPPAQPEEPSAPAPPPRLRLAVFYSGVDFAPEASFNHGVSLSGRLDWEVGLFIGVHAGWTALAKPSGPLVVRRFPVGAAIGYRIQLLPQVWADFELGALLDFLERTTRGDQAGQGDSLRLAAAVAPRLRGEYRPLELLGFFAGFGLDVALTTLRYRADDEPNETLLSPSWVRPVLEAGIALYP